MRKIILYIAQSLDGYIARKNGAIDWLPSGGDGDYGYSDFLSTIGTVLMGRKTYEQCLTFGEFPYRDKACYVFTRDETKSKAEFVQFVHGGVVSLVRRWRASNKKNDIWLVGGAQLICEFQRHGLIDEYIITTCPILLGSGIPLFEENAAERKLTLQSQKAFKGGLVQSRYTKAD